jgi:uncharacterized membrane protein YdjX (TVP38/TMEM64 family)
LNQEPTTITKPDAAGTDAPEPTKPRDVLKKLGPAGALGIAWLALPPLCSVMLFAYSRTISEWFRSHGDVRGIALFVGAFVLLAGLGLLPTYAQAILAGFAFGQTNGFLAALAGFAGASLIGYLVARTVSQGRVLEVIASNPKAQAVADALMHREAWRTLGIVALLRLPPNSPFAISNLVMASVRIPLPIFLVGTVIGMSPRTFVAVYFGSQLQVWTGKESPPWAVVVGGAVVTLVAMAVIGVIANQALTRVTGKGAVGGSKGKAAPGVDE